MMIPGAAWIKIAGAVATNKTLTNLKYVCAFGDNRCAATFLFSSHYLIITRKLWLQKHTLISDSSLLRSFFFLSLRSAVWRTASRQRLAGKLRHPFSPLGGSINEPMASFYN